LEAVEAGNVSDSPRGGWACRHRRRDFRNRSEIDANPDLRIAFPAEPYYLDRAKVFLPNAQIVPVREIETFLEAEDGEFDAMIFVGEVLASHSLLNPEFGVVVPKPPFDSVPAAYVLPLGEPEWHDTINGWITLKPRRAALDRVRSR
jgi:hypothetical protein